jgi:hypothetical protein
VTNEVWVQGACWNMPVVSRITDMVKRPTLACPFEFFHFLNQYEEK